MRMKKEKDMIPIAIISNELNKNQRRKESKIMIVI